MIELRETAEFAKWFAALKDKRARDRIQVRLSRLELGLPGDVRPVGEDVSELRIDYGAGYRMYFKRRGSQLIFLLAGGDKLTQARDIKKAQELATHL